jgi:hypothetical protein
LFMQWLRSLGDLLYEVMSWLIFFPVTLWRALTHPLRMMAYVDNELGQPAEEQFVDTLNPPLFLVLGFLCSTQSAWRSGRTELRSSPIRKVSRG